MSIGGANHIQRIDGVCVGGAREGRALNGCTLPTPHVPENYLSRVSAPYDITRVELAECYGSDGALQGSKEQL